MVVMLDAPCSEVVWRVLATHSMRQFPFHFPSHTSPCATTFQLELTTVLWLSRTMHPATQCHIPGDLYLQHHSSGNLKSSSKTFTKDRDWECLRYYNVTHSADGRSWKDCIKLKAQGTGRHRKNYDNSKRCTQFTFTSKMYLHTYTSSTFENQNCFQHSLYNLESIRNAFRNDSDNCPLSVNRININQLSTQQFQIISNLCYSLHVTQHIQIKCTIF